MIRMQCPGCEEQLRITDALAGTSGECPGCGTEFEIPDSGDPAAPETDEATQPDAEEPVQQEAEESETEALVPPEGDDGSADEEPKDDAQGESDEPAKPDTEENQTDDPGQDEPEPFDPMDVLGEMPAPILPPDPDPAAASESIEHESDEPKIGESTDPDPLAEPAPDAASETSRAAEDAMAAMQHRVPLPVAAPGPATQVTGESPAAMDSQRQAAARLLEAVRNNRLYATLAGLVLLLGIVFMPKGCDDDRVPVYPVAGKVVFVDGSLVRTGTIELESVQYGTTSTGRIAEDGSFVLGTYDVNDGAPAGEHRVIVVQMVIADGTINHTKDHGLPVDPRFSRYETSGLKTQVKPDDENQLVIEVQAQPNYE